MKRRSNTSASTRLLALAAIAAAALALEGAPAAAQAARPETALAELVVNGQRRGTIEFQLDESGGILLPSGALRSLLSGLVEPSILERVAGGDRILRSSELGPLGIALSFDESNLALSLSVAPASMAGSRIGLSQGPARKGEARVGNAAFAASLGTGLELGSSYRGGGADGLSYSARLDLRPAVRALDLVAEGAGSLGYDASGLSWRIDSARALADFPSLGARLEAGIVGVSAAAFQSGAELYGLSFARSRALPGATKPLPALPGEFVLEHQADLVLEVNGLAIRQLRLGPGKYSIADLALSTGLNEVKLIIREDGASPREMRFGIPFDESLVGVGGLDYAVALGAARSDPAMPIGAGRISLGVGPYLQLGADAEAGFGTALGGVSLLAALPLGTLGFAGALSLPLSPEEDRPPAFAARASWRFSSPGRPYAPRLGAVAEYRGIGFAAPQAQLSAADPYPSWRLSGQLAQSLPRGVGTISGFGEAALEGGNLGSWSATLGLTLPLARTALLSFAGGYDWSRASGLAPRASLSLTVAPPDRRSLSYRRDLVKGSDSVDLSIGLDETGTGSLGLYGEGLVGRGVDRVLGFSATGRSPEATISAAGRYSRIAAQGSADFSGKLGFSSTLALAEGVLAATSSPGEAYAILLPAAELKGTRVELRSSDGLPSSSDSGRASIVSGLTPYKDYVAEIEMPLSPPETRPHPSSVELSPAYRSVSVIRVGAEPSISARGLLLDNSGRPVPNMAGDVVDSSGAAAPFSGTFTDERGIFECYGLSPGPTLIRWENGWLSSFMIPPSPPGSIIELAPVSSAMPETGGGKP